MAGHSTNYALINIRKVLCMTPKPCRLSFTISLGGSVLYASPESLFSLSNSSWDVNVNVWCTKKQVDEDLIELNFLEKKTSVGVVDMPLRTLATRHYFEPRSHHHHHSSEDNAYSRLPDVSEKSQEWLGFVGQLVSKDTVRGTVYLDCAATSSQRLNELMSSFKFFYVGVENLYYLAQYDPVKLVSYITPEMLKLLKLATMSQVISDNPESSKRSKDKEKRKSISKTSKVLGVATEIIDMEASFAASEPDSEQRELLLGLWRQFFSASTAVRKALMNNGIFPVAKKCLSKLEDSELVMHFLEGLKYFFSFPEAQAIMIKKGLLKKVVDAAVQKCTTPFQALVAMRAFSLIYYFEDCSQMLIEVDIITELTKIVADSTAFLPIRTKALDFLRIFIPDFCDKVLIKDTTNVFSEIISTNSSKVTHQTFLARIIAFLRFVAPKVPQYLDQAGLFKLLINLLVSKTTTESNKLAALELLSVCLDSHLTNLIDLGLAKNMLTMLIDPASPQSLHMAVMDTLTRPEFRSDDAYKHLVDSGLLQSLFSLIVSTQYPQEAEIAKQFLAKARVTPSTLLSSGCLPSLEVIFTIENINNPSFSGVWAFNLLLGIITDCARSGPSPDLEKSLFTQVAIKALCLGINNPAFTDPVLVNMFNPPGSQKITLSDSLLNCLIDLFCCYSEDSFLENNLYYILVAYLLQSNNPQIISKIEAFLPGRTDWIMKVQREPLLQMLENYFNMSLSANDRVNAILQALPAGFGHVPLLYRLLSNLRATDNAFTALYSNLSKYAAYNEWRQHPLFLPTLLVDVKNPKCAAFLTFVKDEVSRLPLVAQTLASPDNLAKLFTMLVDSIALSKTATNVTLPTKESVLIIKECTFTLLSNAPSLLDYLSNGHLASLFALLEPASGFQVIQWVFQSIEKLLPVNSDALLSDMHIREVLWSIITSSDLSSADGQGDGKNIYPTKVGEAAWSLLTKCPDYLAWLQLYQCYKVVTAWFFGSNPAFQLIALQIMEPVRWARVGCSTSEEFEKWRIQLNKGRLAFCTTAKGIHPKEVSKLARSFVRNGVIPPDLSWLTNKEQMNAYFRKFIELERHLKPATPAEQAVESSTLLEWLRFLRLCQNGEVKRRFTGLLDTFHDSIFFLPDTTSSNTDWNIYYKVTPPPEGAMTSVSMVGVVRTTGGKSSKAHSTALGRRALTSSHSQILKTSTTSSSLSSTKYPVAPPAVASWQQSTAAHFQILKYWQFSTITIKSPLIDVWTSTRTTYELCFDSFKHGFDTSELRKRTDSLAKLLLVLKIKSNDPVLAKNEDPVIAWFNPLSYVWVKPEVQSTASKAIYVKDTIGCCFKGTDQTKQEATFNSFTSQSSSYKLCAETKSLEIWNDSSSTQDADLVIDLASHTLHMRDQSTWATTYGISPISPIAIVHMQVFRVFSNASNVKMTVNTRRGFATGTDNEGSFDLFDDGGAADSDVSSQTDLSSNNDIDTGEASENNSDSFMNGILARVMNGFLKSHYAKMSSQSPALQSLVPTGPTPNWVRVYSSLTSKTTLIDASPMETSPVIAIVILKPEDEGDPTSSNETKTPYIFGFYLHKGLATNSTGFVRDEFAFLFSLHGPNANKPVFYPISMSQSQNTYQVISNDTIQFGLGTDLMLNFVDPSMSFANLGYSYTLPDGVTFMSKEALTAFSDQPATTWDYADVQLYVRTDQKSKVSSPYPAFGHLIRLLDQADISTLQQIRWRLKYLMISGTPESKTQIMEEIQRAHSADVQLRATEPVNNLVKRIEHPGVEKVTLVPVALNGQALTTEQHKLLCKMTTGNVQFIAPEDVSPLDITYAVLPGSYQSRQTQLTDDEIHQIPFNEIPYLLHISVMAKKDKSGKGKSEPATKFLVFSSDYLQTPSQISSAFALHTPYDSYRKLLKINAADHLAWYERFNPSALDPSTQFRIGPVLMNAVQKEDTGMVSNVDDPFWSFLSDSTVTALQEVQNTKVITLPVEELNIRNYLLDKTRAIAEPIAFAEIPDGEDKEIGEAALSAAVRSRYITLRILPNADNNFPVSFDAIRVVGYNPAANHDLCPPKPDTLSDVTSIYTNNIKFSSKDEISIDYEWDDTGGLLKWLRDTVCNSNLMEFQKHFKLTFSHHLFNATSMNRESFFNGKPLPIFYWGGGNPTWFSVEFKTVAIHPTAFMLRHGYNKNNSFIHNFIFQASKDGNSWTSIKSYDSHYHSFAGQSLVFSDFQVPAIQYYSRFRILQKGNYFMSATSPGAPYMCISEWEIFGQARSISEDGDILAALDGKHDTTAQNVVEVFKFKSTYESPTSKKVVPWIDNSTLGPEPSA